MNNTINPLLKETFIFRPLKQHGNMLRYAEGRWIPDDGLPDMAFVYYDDFPAVEYVRMPYYTNILWEWSELVDRKATWHYCTTNNQNWGGYRFKERNRHPNEVASESGMRKCCDLYHCANGRSISLTSDNDYIKLGKLTIQSTGKPVTKPDNRVCFLCLNDGYGHQLQVLQSKKARLEEDKGYYERELRDHEVALYDTAQALDRTSKDLGELEQALAKAEGKEKK